MNIANLRIFLLLIILLSFTLSCKQKSNYSNSPSDTLLTIPHPEMLDSILEGYVDRGSYPFIYARLERQDGSVLYEHGVVNRNLFPELTVDKDSWIRIWSMSKVVTISVALDMVEDGVIKFTDEVTNYIPEFKNLRVARGANGENLTSFNRDSLQYICPLQYEPLDSSMTILDLLNHHAGFYYAITGIDCLDDLMAEANLPKAKDTDEIIDRMSQLPLIMQPREVDFYGTNTSVLGFVLERASGKSLKSLVEERVTSPLQISGLQYTLPVGAQLVPPVSGKDSILRLAKRGELDIFGPDVPDYDSDHKLYLGGEGMLATADGYADFVRMLINRGTLNGNRFLDQSSIEDLSAPHTQLNSPYGHNGYNLWVSGDSMRINGHGDAGLWIGGGYEGTHFWADPKRKFVGVLMTQMFWIPNNDYGRDNDFRGAVYKQLFEQEKR